MKNLMQFKKEQELKPWRAATNTARIPLQAIDGIISDYEKKKIDGDTAMKMISKSKKDIIDALKLIRATP